MTITEKLAYSTVRIECEMKDGGACTGTGYFFKFRENLEKQQYVPVVITNKHVIKGAKKGKIIFTIAQNGMPIDTEHFGIFIDNFESSWKFHPSDDVDLCAMPIAPFLNAAERDGKSLFFVPLDVSLIPNKEELNNLSAMEDIVMVGYPNGIWDYVNNKPIYRKGITATHPCIDYNGKREFLIDAGCFPGSSGSPVFILNENGYRDKKGNVFLGKSRIHLMGTLYKGPQFVATGEIGVIDVPTKLAPAVFSSIPNNLGYVIKSERILELEKLF